MCMCMYDILSYSVMLQQAHFSTFNANKRIRLGGDKDIVFCSATDAICTFGLIDNARAQKQPDVVFSVFYDCMLWMTWSPVFGCLNHLSTRRVTSTAAVTTASPGRTFVAQTHIPCYPDCPACAPQRSRTMRVPPFLQLRRHPAKKTPRRLLQCRSSCRAACSSVSGIA